MIGESSINVAESFALRDGLIHALHCRWEKLIVEGDSKLIIDCVQKYITIPWSIQQIIQDIWHLSSFGEAVRFKHVFMEANFIVDALVWLGHDLSSSVLWEHGLPLSVVFLSYFDLFGHVCPRGFAL